MSLTLLSGPDSFGAQRALAGLIAAYVKRYPDVTPEKVEGSAVEPSDLPDLLQGANLFASERLIILKDPSAHKALWGALDAYVDKVADTTELIIIDTAPDKRTKTYKTLQKIATIKDFPEQGPRNASELTTWLMDEGKGRGVSVTRDAARLLIDRAGYDGWALSNALEKLAIVGDASPETIRDLVEPSPGTNAFDIFEAALRGRELDVRATLADLRSSQDPHAFVGLLGGQAFQLALVANSPKSPAELAKLVGGHPYPLQKMGQVARTLNRVDIARAVRAVSECDRDLKHSVAEPWVLIERALLKIAVRA